MILKKNFNPAKVLSYVAIEVSYLLLLSLIIIGVSYHWGVLLAIPFAPISVLGTALAILLAFRNNNAYTRWWEARTLWGNISNNCRTLARQIISGTDDAVMRGKIDRQEADRYNQEMGYRLIAFANSLRVLLRRENQGDELLQFLPKEELEQVIHSSNPPTMMIKIISGKIRDGMRNEWLGAFDNISMEPNLVAMSSWQASCERIKHTPIPKQYEYFTRLFLWIFLTMLPFGLLNIISNTFSIELILPLSLSIGFVFAIVSKTADVTENPFENAIQDVPMTAICREIERDIKELLNQPTLPPILQPVHGHLY